MVTATSATLPPTKHQHIRTALATSGYRPLSRIECDVTESSVVLSGSLPTFFLKQLAQEIVLRLEGIDDVKNCVVVTS